MLRDYPIYFDDVRIPFPQEWAEQYETIETVNQTEAGTDQVLVARYGKLSVSAKFNCSSRWAAKFAVYMGAGALQVKRYDIKTQDYEVRIMRIRDFQSVPVEGSRNTDGTNGLYTITFSLEEY